MHTIKTNEKVIKNMQDFEYTRNMLLVINNFHHIV